MDLGPSAPNVLGNLKISVPPVGLWDPVKGILRIPGGHLRDMDVCPTVSLLHAKDQIPLFTLSIRRIGWSRRYRSINMPSTGSTEMRMHKTSATIVIDGKRMLLKVSLQDDGILRDQHFYQITLRFERLGRKPPCGVSSQLKTPSVHQETFEDNDISVWIKKVWRNVTTPSSSGSARKERDAAHVELTRRNVIRDMN
jgi:hypothetical protein